MAGDFNAWLNDIANLQGNVWANPEQQAGAMHEANELPALKQIFGQGVTADQFVNTPAAKYGAAYAALMDPLKDLNRQDAYAKPELQGLLNSGKVKFVDRGEGAVSGWEPTEAAGLPVPDDLKGMFARGPQGQEATFGPTIIPSKFMGAQMWGGFGSENDPNAIAFDKNYGLVTSRGNQKSGGMDKIMELIGQAAPLMLLAPALGAVMPGLAGLVGGAKGLASNGVRSGASPGGIMQLLNLIRGA